MSCDCMDVGDFVCGDCDVEFCVVEEDCLVGFFVCYLFGCFDGDFWVGC